MTKTIQTIDISNLDSVTGGAPNIHASVDVSALLSALNGGPKTKDAAKFIRALGKVGVR